MRRHESGAPVGRLRLLRIISVLIGILALSQLFRIQIMSHDFYAALADGQHDLFRKLFPERGKIYAHDGDDKTFLMASNRQLSLVFAEPHRLEDPQDAAKKLAPILGLDEAELAAKLDDPTARYRPLKRQVDDDVRNAVAALKIEGIGFSDEDKRYYPERTAAAHVLGFVGSDESGAPVGRYGIEGWFDERLAGEQGFLESEKDSFGRLIAVGNRTLEPARDGDDLVLTIDRTVEVVACRKLEEWVAQHQAERGVVIILEPKTGAVIAMCGAPTFDPNDYNKVESVDVFNNMAIFGAYEPGSIFKTMTIAGGLDAGLISPTSTFEDTGEVKFGKFTIRNSDLMAHGVVTMTEVLSESLNTGLVDVVLKIGPPKFNDLVHDFGFGEKTGIELQTEAAGDVSVLAKKGQIYAATGSFGQGITVTPLQITAAYAAIANGGVLMKPYIIDEVRTPDGKTEKTEPAVVRRVISERASKLLSGMLVDVVENGHGKRAGVEGYWIGGKTGTAQIPRTDGPGYEQGAAIGSFAGFGPIEDPKFVMLVRVDRPQGVEFAESSAAPLFGDIAKFLLDYYQIPPTRR